MNLWQIWSLVEYISNKDFSGNVITPQRFNELIKVVNMDLFRTKYGLPEEFQPGRPVATEYADITLKNTDDLRAFKVSLTGVAVTNGILPLNANYAHRDTVTYNYTKTINNVVTVLPRPVEILREAEFASRNGNWTKKPTLQYPIGVVRMDGIHIRPLTILAVDFNYYRWPGDPNFVYIEGDGFITYDAATSVEYEWAKDEHLTLTRMILQYVGVNLREADLVQYSEQKLKTG
jgi:hypothetical protein